MNTQKLYQLKKKAHELLEKPGVYKMLDRDGHLLYIGKSIRLNKRVASYFTDSPNRSRKISRMIRQINDFEVYYTDTELDALLIECQWIQGQKPPYNTVLTTTSRYRYFEIYGAESYELKMSRMPNQKAHLRIGPLPHKKLSQHAYEFMKSYYPEFFPKKKYGELVLGRQKEMNEWKQCKEGLNLITQVEEVLMSRDDLCKRLEKQMESYSEQWAYEEAAKVLYELKGLKYMQYIYQLTNRVLRENVVGILPIPGTFMYKYYMISGGTIIKRIKGTKQEEAKIIEELKILCQKEMYSKKESILPSEIDQVLIVESFKHKGMHIIKV